MAELAKAYVQIIPSAEGIQGRLTEMMDGEADSAGKSAGGKFGSAFGSVAKAGLAAAGAGLAAASGAVIAVAKDAVAGYADYEQLVGGIETLFGASSEAVQKNAARAFQTAGLSANEYMETVTSFSASLLQSLDGDTYEAMESADKAIRDMSDNANKMGTSMESIQNAYRGFAKANYTMLDNLSLGYGGTKEEMARLLNDATALSGIEYDISSYADIIDAIHVIQDNLGITGTTAKEASSTISGSLASMKSAWNNLLVGMANPDVDLSALIGNIVTSAETVFNNIMPVAEQALSGIATFIEQIAPVIAEKLPGIVDAVLPSVLSAASSLITALIAALPSLVQVLIEQGPVIINQILTTILDMLPEIIALGMTLITSLATGIAENLPELIPTVVDVVLEIVDTLTDPDTLGLLVDASIAIIIALAEGLIDALPKLLEKAPEIIRNLVTAIVENVPKLFEAALKIITELVKGIKDNFYRLTKAAWEIVQTILDGIGDIFSKMLDIGSDIVGGIWQGISNGYTWITTKIQGWVGDVVGFFKRILGISSPSKVFAELGGFMSEGVAIGIEDNIGSVERAVSDMSDAAVSAWSADRLNMGISGAASYNFGSATINDSKTLADSISAALNGAGVYMDGHVVGRLVTRMQTNAARVYG